MFTVTRRWHWLLSIALIFCLTLTAFGQYDFLGREIEGNFVNAISVFAADLDGDDDIDILGAGRGADQIRLWENEGDRDFTQHTVAVNFNGAISVFAIDMDDDLDIDILGAALYDDKITWWENTGDMNFITGDEHVISDTINGAMSVFALDMEGDGDIDVIGAGTDADVIRWWENDSEQNFTEHTIAEDFSGASSVYATDVDGDGDIDVLGSATNVNTIAWFENDGAQNFTEHIITANFDYAVDIQGADLDSDGDMDVLGAAFRGSEFTWWENRGNQNFTEHTLTDELNNPGSIRTADIDGDGDLDIIGAAYGESSIFWWENDGNRNFTEHTVGDGLGGAWGVCAADIDNDGAVDVVGAGFTAHSIWWWENNLDPDPDASVEGTITDAETGDPVRYADVRFGLLQTTADNQGFYQIEDAYTIAYTVRINATGYERHIETGVELEEGDNTFDFELHYPASGTWSPHSIRLNTEEGEISTTILTVGNEGGVDLNFEIQTTERWLSVDIDEGSIPPGDELEIEVEGDARRLIDRDIYEALLQFETNDPDNLYREFPVTFYVGYEPPSPFSLLVPDSGHVFFFPEVEFAWQEAIEPDSGETVEYMIFISTDPDNMDDPFETGLTDTTYAFYAPNPTIYFWTIFAVDRYLEGTWADNVWSFEIDPPEPPTPFVLLEPVDGDTLPLADPFEVTTIWRLSVDPDPHEGAVYSLHFRVTLDDGEVETLDFHSWRDTLRTIDIPMRLNLQPWRSYLEVQWYVEATSAGDTTECNRRFTFYMEPAVGIPPQPFKAIPTDYSIAALYPNPFNPVLVTVIGLPQASDLDIRIFNILGEQVASLAGGHYPAGYHDFSFKAVVLSSGIYFVHASVPGRMNEVRKVLLIK